LGVEFQQHGNNSFVTSKSRVMQGALSCATKREFRNGEKLRGGFFLIAVFGFELHKQHINVALTKLARKYSHMYVTAD